MVIESGYNFVLEDFDALLVVEGDAFALGFADFFVLFDVRCGTIREMVISTLCVNS